jgi:trans-AT polyketide synthase/acyltransferase/oxidoreductase domain-containing protein
VNAYVFPGQGSQVKGMGADLFDEFSEYTEEANETLEYSIKEICLEDPENKLGITKYTQPALFVVNALSYLKKKKESKRLPDYMLGHSLGEYNALLAAGVFDFKTGLQLVKLRGELMYQARYGGMAAVIGLSQQQVKAIIRENDFYDLDIANLNTPSQIVIAGSNESIAAAQPVFEERGAKRYVTLAVSGAFHSRYMTSAANEFTKYLKSQVFKVPKIPIISNYTARPYGIFETVENLSNQINHEVRWVESIEYLLDKGVVRFEQIGPGMVSIGMVKSIQRAKK